MPEISDYASAYYSMTWEGPRGYPEDANAGRCYITGMLGMLRYQGEPDVLFADGTSGDGFSFRWCPAWGRAGAVLTRAQRRTRRGRRRSHRSHEALGSQR